MAQQKVTAKRFTSALRKVYGGWIREIEEYNDPDEMYLDYDDALQVSDWIRDEFDKLLGDIPDEVEIALQLSVAVLAPTVNEKAQLIRGVTGIAGGAAGIGMIITGIGSALGWGAGVTATVTAFFAGTSLLGPVAWLAGGAAVAGIAAYFAFSSNPYKNSERFKACLNQSLENAISEIWDEYSYSDIITPTKFNIWKKKYQL